MVQPDRVGQYSTTTLASGRHSGDQIQVVANKLHDFTHIKLRVVRGTMRLKSISFVQFDLPTCTCSFDPATDNLSDGLLKIDRQEVSGTQSLAIFEQDTGGYIHSDRHGRATFGPHR